MPSTAEIIPFPMENILSLVESAGEDVLTEDEYEAYVAYRQANAESPDDHYANLAEFMDSTELDRISTDVIRWCDWDEESREEWEQREAKGMRLLGVSDKVEGGASFEGASRVVHPLLAEAVVQFQSRAIVELWPAEGPVKTIVVGEKTEETLAQARRVQEFMNYQYTTLMPGGFEEEDQLLFRLPLSGSCFKKVFYCPLEKTIVSRLVEPADFIVPYSATDLRSAPRYTHRIREMRNDVMKKMRDGFYRKVKLTFPVNDDYPDVIDEIDYSEGRQRNGLDDDERHTILEMHVDLDLFGFEDEKDGEFTGVALPYIVTVDRDNQEVLSIRRNWKENDADKRKRVYFIHYKFTPGYGFYGYGLLHLIGGLSNSATGALRSLLDAAAFKNMPGGYKSKDAKIEGGDVPVGPGEWREVQSSAEELSRAFFKLPYEEPSKVLFNLLGYLDERGQRFASTTENMVGEANNSAPVGTTMALIEQGSKVFTAIHRRLHEAHTREFRLVAELNKEYLSEAGYPFGPDKYIMASDFDDRVDILPVSDPNLISSTQRIAQSQAVLELAEKFPDVYDRVEANKMMLEALRVPDITRLIPDKSNVPNPSEIREQAEAEQVQAETEKTKAEATVKKVEALYSATQAAQAIATIPQITPIADELLASAGYEDANGPPIAGSPGEAAMLPVRTTHQIRTNTDPRFPANPESPSVGMQEGIETPENDAF